MKSKYGVVPGTQLRKDGPRPQTKVAIHIDYFANATVILMSYCHCHAQHVACCSRCQTLQMQLPSGPQCASFSTVRATVTMHVNAPMLLLLLMMGMLVQSEPASMLVLPVTFLKTDSFRRQCPMPPQRILSQATPVAKGKRRRVRCHFMISLISLRLRPEPIPPLPTAYGRLDGDGEAGVRLF